MKSKYFYLFATFALAALLLINACDKGDKCNGIYCAQALPTITLDFVDKQGRDLLNPSTPNHIDSAKLMQLNNGEIYVQRSSTIASINRRRVTLLWKDQESVTMYLKLTETDQDTIKYTQVKNESCCTSYQLTSFSYNGKAYTDSVARHYFTVVK